MDTYVHVKFIYLWIWHGIITIFAIEKKLKPGPSSLSGIRGDADSRPCWGFPCDPDLRLEANLPDQEGEEGALFNYYYMIYIHNIYYIRGGILNKVLLCDHHCCYQMMWRMEFLTQAHRQTASQLVPVDDDSELNSDAITHGGEMMLMIENDRPRQERGKKYIFFVFYKKFIYITKT